MRSCSSTNLCRQAVAAVAIAASLLGGTPVLAGPIAIQPHKASYRLSFGSASADGDFRVAQARGRITFEWSDGCDGWIIKQRTRIWTSTVAGSESELGMSVNAWEAKDGSRFRFSIRNLLPFGEVEELTGQAEVGPDGGEARFEEGHGPLALPAGTMFPTGHDLAMIEAAREGQPVLFRTVFDGDGEYGLMDVSSVVLSALGPEASPSAAAIDLAGARSWRLGVAYFDADAEALEPDHEQSFRMYENGVVDELTLDFRDFSLEGMLESLEFLPPADC